jgi:hypothetical protein
MHFPARLLAYLCLLLSLPLAADTTTYQTAPKVPSEQTRQVWSAPLISVDPQTGKTRIFIQPDGSFSNSPASHGTPVYHARVLYKSTSTGISDSIIKLYRQMADACPQGWIKLQEWASLQTDTPELHYQFQCLHASPQD